MHLFLYTEELKLSSDVAYEVTNVCFDHPDGEIGEYYLRSFFSSLS